MKKLVIFLWSELGMPRMWILIMFALVLFEGIYGATLFGGFWVAVCLMAYYLSRIAAAIENITQISAEISDE